MVAQIGTKLAGYIIYELGKTQVHVLNLAVAEVYRRQGVATTLVDSIKRKLHPDRRSAINLEVRESNLRAQLLFRSLGFRAVRILRDYYEDTTEDSYRMSYSVLPQVQFNPKNRLASYFQSTLCGNRCRS